VDQPEGARLLLLSSSRDKFPVNDQRRSRINAVCENSIFAAVERRPMLVFETRSIGETTDDYDFDNCNEEEPGADSEWSEVSIPYSLSNWIGLPHSSPKIRLDIGKRPA